MSVSNALSRISEIQALLQSGAAPAASPRTTATTGTAFADQLSSQVAVGGALASASTGSPIATAAVAAPGAGNRMVQIAEAELGQAEQPPGSNDSPRIAQYRTATSGSGIGPWCGYFASWVAQQAGTPLGEAGQGFGSVDAVAGWAQRTGRYFAAGQGTPQPGDLILWGGQHIGIVESVGADGSISTIEGNSSNAVSRRSYGPDGGGATGYVRVG